MQLQMMTAENMTPLVGTIFRVNPPEGEGCDLRLENVRKVLDKHADARFRRDSFSLYFIGPPQPFLPQATYAMSHPTLGDVDLFIVPNARTADGFRYEAVFT
ncbi:MAG: uncharacterized protein JWN02_1256 [Acidobacteria bacterium]|nr:uncharacterized protein [Acidobacteriota bacterium]